jgi:hypothetical protein
MPDSNRLSLPRQSLPSPPRQATTHSSALTNPVRRRWQFRVASENDAAVQESLDRTIRALMPWRERCVRHDLVPREPALK